MFINRSSKCFVGLTMIIAAFLVVQTLPADAAGDHKPSCPISAKKDGPWYPSVVAFEHFDSGRTHTFRCATFGGSMRGENAIHARPFTDTYPTPYNLVLRKRHEGYVYGGAYGDYPNAPGSFVAKFDPRTDRQIWRTQLFDAPAHPQTWNYPGVVAVHQNGKVYVVYGTTLAKLDPRTGKVLGKTALPYDGPKDDASYNGFDGFSDGMLVMKTVYRQAGCDEQGFSAFLRCEDPNDVPPSRIAVVDPKTMKLVADVKAPEPIGGRLTTTRFNGADRLYLPGSTSVYRYTWSNGKLKRDAGWGPVPYLLPGQTTAPAAAVVGKWIVLQTNALPAQTPMSLVAISQSDAKLSRMEPFPRTASFQVSFLPSMVSADRANSRVYAMDAGVGRIGAFSLNQKSGALTAAWRRAQRTLNFSTLIGPKSKRVFVATDVPVQTAQELATYTTEAVVFRSARTGRELARSTQLPKMTSGALVTPGEDGRINYLGLGGEIIRLSVKPARASGG